MYVRWGFNPWGTMYRQEDIVGFDTEIITNLGFIPQQPWPVVCHHMSPIMGRCHPVISTKFYQHGGMMPTITLRLNGWPVPWFMSSCSPLNMPEIWDKTLGLCPKFQADLVANVMTFIMGFYGHFGVQLSWLTLYLRYPNSIFRRVVSCPHCQIKAIQRPKIWISFF